jgi:hypothetical protein
MTLNRDHQSDNALAVSPTDVALPLDDHKSQIYMESFYVKLLSKLILISACSWVVSGPAVALCNPSACPRQPPPALPPPSPPAQGVTPAQIAANFPAYIIWQFQNAGAGGMDSTITGMTDKELYILASFFVQNGGNQPLLMQLAAESLSALNLVRWQAAFTQAVVSPYVGAYTPAPISTTYFSHPALRAVVHPTPLPAPVPTDPFALFGVPISDLYLEFRTNPNNNCGPVCAMSKVLALIGGNLKIAWNTGVAIGTTFYNAMTAIDPSYGYDLVVSGGNIMWEQNGLPIPPGAQGYFENPDGSFYDGYGNLIPAPVTTSYGIGPPADSLPPFTFFDPFGDCLFDLECLGN